MSTVNPATQQFEIVFADHLRVGAQEHGRVESDLAFHEHDAFADRLGAHVRELTVINTMDCMEDRPNFAIADGPNDKDSLRTRIAPQWPGGLVLATTKAAVAANAAFLRDAHNIIEAYEIAEDVLTALGYEDAAHTNCGASAKLIASTEEPVAREIALPTIDMAIGANPNNTNAYNDIRAHRDGLVAGGFYDSWDPAWHEERVVERFPHNFTAVKGLHGARGVLALTDPSLGFAKTAFNHETGEMSFGITPPKVTEIAYKLGGTAEERRRILVGFGDDLANVGNQLLAPGIPVFVQRQAEHK